MQAWLPDKFTIGEFIRTVLGITNESDASDFYEWYLDWVNRQIAAGDWKSDYSAERGAKENIGWCFGEGMAPERIQMWIKVCGASHPIFGQSIPGPKEAFDMGVAWGEKAKREST
jgi:hypothetical protein